MPVETRLIGFVESERLIEQTAQPSSMQDTTDIRDTAYRPGDLFAGRYRLIRLIGQGGMGVVWEAQNDALDIRVAIKLIHQSTATPEERQRLIFEARAAARLVDPGVVRVFDCGEAPSGEPYIVMEYLEGQDLASRLDQRGRLSPIEAVRTLLPIVRALGTAHAASIVHRDVKPENVFLTRSATGEEQPKLLDFGIAKIELPWEKRLTQAGSALGSPNYMSPEQARGEEVDPRADLWGLCVVLYEVITDRLPFDGNGYNAVMYSILTSSPATFMELGVKEPELWEIIARGLERDRSLRWQSSVELHRALSDWLIARGVMHDVSGVSLHAGMQHRASHVRTLESVRPAAVSLTNEGGHQSSSRLVTGAARRSSQWGLSAGSQRPTWFLPLISAFVLVVASAVGWRVWSSWRKVPVLPAVPETIASAPVPTPIASAPPTTASPILILPSSQPPSSLGASTSRAVSTPRKSQAQPSGTAKSAGATQKAPAKAKADSFKSPFD